MATTPPGLVPPGDWASPDNTATVTPQQQGVPWWKRILQTPGAPGAILGGVAGFAGMATGNPYLRAGGFAFGEGSAEEGVRQAHQEHEALLEQRKRKFEESQLRVRDLAQRVEQWRPLTSLKPPVPNPAATVDEQARDARVGQMITQAKHALGEWDIAKTKPGGVTEADVKKATDSLTAVDWSVLQQQQMSEQTKLKVEAEERAKMDIAGKQREERLRHMTPQDQQSLGFQNLQSPEDFARASGELGSREALAGQADVPVRVAVDGQGKPRMLNAGEQEGPGEHIVWTKPTEFARMESSYRGLLGEQRRTEAMDRISQRDLQRQQLQEQREKRLQSDTELHERLATWEQEHKAWEGEQRTGGLAGRGKPEPLSPRWIKDAIEASGGDLANLPPAQYKDIMKKRFPRQQDRDYAERLLREKVRQLQPPPQ